MSHEMSLDSERATFSNPIRGIRELLSLYEMGNNFGAAGKRVLVGAELSEILENDLVINNSTYKGIAQRLTTFLNEKSNTGGDPEQCRINKRSGLVKSLLRELNETLSQNYLKDCLNEIKSELASFELGTKDEHFKKIISLTNSVMGALAANGAGMQETNAFYRFILMKQGESTFEQRFERLQSAALSPNESYDLTFKIRSKALVDMLEGQGPSINFGPLNITPKDERILESKCTLEAQSFTIAGAKAYDLLVEFVDALSYTLGKQEINIETNYTAKSLSRNQTKSFKIHRPIPNPNYEFEKEKFLNFCQSIESNNDDAYKGIKDNKISAAFRLLRVGTLSTSVESKYTSYWTALESLARDVFDRQGGDDDRVIAATLPCIAIDYVTKKLRSFVSAFHNINKVDFEVEGGESFTLRNMGPANLYDFLVEEEKREVLINSVYEYPYFQFKLRNFSEFFSSSLKMHNRIEMHERKVSQHLRRIYRVRNLIVHDAQNIEGLEQLCAHLEHYLKGCLNTMLELMAVKPTIHTPREFFIRYSDLVDEVKEQLDPSSKIKSEKNRLKESERLKRENYSEHSKLRELVLIHQ